MKLGRQFTSNIAFNRSVLLWLPAVYNALPWPWTIYIDLWLINCCFRNYVWVVLVGCQHQANQKPSRLNIHSHGRKWNLKDDFKNVQKWKFSHHVISFKSGEVSWSTTHLGCSTVKQRCSILPNNWSIWSWKCKKINVNQCKIHTAHPV